MTAWVLVFEGGCMDGHERASQVQPEPEVILWGAPAPTIMNGSGEVCRREDTIDTVEGRWYTGLLGPGQWARYRLQFGVFPGPMRYRLVEECLEPF